jgi:lysophospholipase L1-like esterase
MRRVVLVIASVVAVRCGSRRAMPPAPTPPVPSPPAIDCPADLSAQAHVGILPKVEFEVPAPRDGQPPVNVVCTPASGSEFPVGKDTVVCEATDALARKASCTFSVVVAPVPMLDKTKFLAFGDSITEGKVRGVRALGPRLEFPDTSYTGKLRTKLVARYEDQALSIAVVNDGVGEEQAGVGKIRLPGELNLYKPQVLLLLEGANELVDPKGVDNLSVQSAADALQKMVNDSRAVGVQVFLATLTPMNPGTRPTAGFVPLLNAKIRAIGGASIVDLYAAFNNDLTFIGPDGLHPTAQGYDLIADTFLKSIMAELETKTPAPSQSVLPALGLRPPAQILPRH